MVRSKIFNSLTFIDFMTDIKIKNIRISLYENGTVHLAEVQINDCTFTLSKERAIEFVKYIEENDALLSVEKGTAKGYARQSRSTTQEVIVRFNA